MVSISKPVDDGRFAEALKAVEEFVAGHPEIEMTATGTAIPRSCREGFFETVSSARKLAAQQIIGGDGFAASSCERLSKARSRLKDSFGLAVVVPSELEAYIADPLDGVSALTTDLFFGYLQGKVERDAFEVRLRSSIEEENRRLSCAAYETWLYLDTIAAFSPTRAYSTSTHDQKTVQVNPTDTLVLGRQDYSAVLRLPEIVLETGQGYVGMKLELANEVDFYGSKPLRRRDYSTGGDSSNIVGRRYVLLYRIADLETVPLTANRDTGLVIPPLAMIAAIFPDDVEQNLYCRGTIQRVETLGSIGGAFFADPKGCAALIGECNEPYGAAIRIGAPGFDDQGLRAYLASL